MCQTIHPSLCPSTCLIYLYGSFSICMSIHLYVWTSLPLCDNQSICFVHSSVCLWLCLYICLSAYLSFPQSVCFYVIMLSVLILNVVILNVVPPFDFKGGNTHGIPLRVRAPSHTLQVYLAIPVSRVKRTSFVPRIRFMDISWNWGADWPGGLPVKMSSSRNRHRVTLERALNWSWVTCSGGNNKSEGWGQYYKTFLPVINEFA